MAGYIHDDIKEILEDAAKNNKPKTPSTVGWSDLQLKCLNELLQYAWNRGYKSATNDLQE